MASIAIKKRFGCCSFSFERDVYFDKDGCKVYGERYVHIYNLYVCPEFRRQGKAKRILQAAIKMIRRTGYAGRIKIVARPDDGINAKKIASFYKRLGLDVYECYA